eukprot:gene19063-24885_t
MILLLSTINHILQSNKTIFAIDLAGARAIASGLGTLSTLTYLDISDNFTGLDPYGNPNSEGIAALSTQLSQSYGMKLIDFSGNYCLGNGSAALKEAIVSHSTLADIRTGLREINISHNPIGYPGVKHLAEAIGMKLLQLALAENNSVVNLDLSNNPASIESVTIAMAESDAMKLIVDLRKDATSVDTGRLSPLDVEHYSRQ